jgi:hypothetical protein
VPLPTYTCAHIHTYILQLGGASIEESVPLPTYTYTHIHTYILQLGGASIEESVPLPTKINALDGKGVELCSCTQSSVMAVTVKGEIWTWGVPDSSGTLNVESVRAALGTYIYIYIYIHTYIHIYLQTYGEIWAWGAHDSSGFLYVESVRDIHTYIHIYIHSCIHTYMHTYIDSLLMIHTGVYTWP